MIDEGMIGKSAGKICYTNLDHHDVALSSILEGAEIMWESGRSAWILVEESLDGGTIWRSPIGDKSARVSPSGEIFIEPIL
jgi:hypothetical protein